MRGSHDQQTEVGRSRERWRRILLAALGTGGFRLVSMTGTFVTLPFIIRYAGNDGYGLFAVVTTLSGMLAFSDLGIGNGLIGALALSEGQQDRRASRNLVSSAFFLLFAIASGILGLFLAAYAFVDWAGLLNVPPDLASEAEWSVLVFAVCFVVGMPASLAQRVHMGLQEGLLASLWGLLGALTTIVGIVVCIIYQAPVQWLVLAAVGGTTAAMLGNFLMLFGHSRPDLRPSWRCVTRLGVRRLATTGGLFFVLGVAGAVAFQTDLVVVSAVLGAAAVTTYAIPLRLFSLPVLIASFVLMPLWPAYSDALARGDTAWIRRTWLRSLLLSTVINVPAAIMLLAFGKQIVAAWVGPGVVVPWSLLLGFALWTCISSLLGPIAMLLNGAGVVRFQVVWACVMALTNIGLSIILTRTIGVAGPIIGTLIATTCCSVIPSLFLIRRLLRTR